jgi:ABC-type polysaccharide/polyol phosphate transport system ATPase subunit
MASPMSSDPRRPVIKAENIGKTYRLYARPHERLLQMLARGRRSYGTALTVLQGVSLEVGRGETVGVIGRNGAGKSTLLRILAGTLRPSAGSVQVQGRVAPLIELGSGFNPELTGRENVVFNGILLGMTEAEVLEKFDRIAAFADIGDYLDRPVKTYSSGMFARLAFSVAIHVDPDVLIVDEILSVGDSAFQRKCVRRFHEVREAGCTILLVAHDEYMVRTTCQQALYLREGRMVAYGDPTEVVDRYLADTMPPRPAAPVVPRAAVPAEEDEPAAAEAAPAEPLPSAEPAAGVLPGDVFRLHGFALQDERGRPVEVARHGSTLRLSFSYEALPCAELPERISFVFNLYTLDGVYVCGSTTLMDRLGPHPAASRGRVTVSFPDLPLLAGTYHWRVAVNDEHGLLVLKDVKGVCPFRVSNAGYRSAGLIHLERDWTVELEACVEMQT